jgi:hypothetical protein
MMCGHWEVEKNITGKLENQARCMLTNTNHEIFLGQNKGVEYIGPDFYQRYCPLFVDLISHIFPQFTLFEQKI